MIPERTQVLIVGGGPCGLMLANELGRRNVSAVLVDDKPSTAFNPQANATQARTMEHYRRLGFAHELRGQGLPPDYPTDIAYFTRFADYELARFQMPSAKDASQVVKTLSGSWQAAELPHRVSQKFVEAVLRKQAEKLPGISLNYGWRMIEFTDHGDHIEAGIAPTEGGRTQTIRADYMMGCDGARSSIRRGFGFEMEGDKGKVRDFFGGRMHAVYLDAPKFYDIVPHGKAWMYVTFNKDRRAFMAAVNGKGEFAFHTQLRPHEKEEEITDEMALSMFERAVGKPVDASLIARQSWTAGFALVSQHFQKGRVFLGGDAVHLFTPTGGLGYNTAVEDAVNLAWKLAAVIKGYGGPKLLETYETERRPLAVRNTNYARSFADSLGLYVAPEEIEDGTPEGEAAREAASEHLNAHARAELNIPGITFGGRYDGSPIIAADGTRPPPDKANEYLPTACPGGRPPHLWLDENTSLYDAFGFEWTLLRLGPNPPEGKGFLDAANRLGMNLTITHVTREDARDLYEADLALIRPDHMVAWRGRSDADANKIIDQVTGH